jgi:hypothetical protein
MKKPPKSMMGMKSGGAMAIAIVMLEAKQDNM